MKITVTTKKELLIVSLSGELDHHTAKKVKELSEETIKNKGVINLIFDFTDLSFMDSSGIGLVMGRFKTLQKSGAKLNLSNLPPNIYKVMKLAGIDRLANIDKGA